MKLSEMRMNIIDNFFLIPGDTAEKKGNKEVEDTSDDEPIQPNIIIPSNNESLDTTFIVTNVNEDGKLQSSSEQHTEL